MYHLQNGLPRPYRTGTPFSPPAPRNPAVGRSPETKTSETHHSGHASTPQDCHHIGSSSQAIIYWVAFSLAFLRVSEYTTKYRSATSSAPDAPPFLPHHKSKHPNTTLLLPSTLGLRTRLRAQGSIMRTCGRSVRQSRQNVLYSTA